MKLNLVKFRDRVFKNIALIFSLSVFLVGCGGQDPVDPNTGDTKGPDISLNFKPNHQPVAVVETQTGLQYIPTSNIVYQDSESVVHNFGSFALKFVKGAGASWAGVWLELQTPIDVVNGQILTAKIYSTKPRNITLKLDAANIEKTVSHPGGGHEVLEFDFSDGMPEGQNKLAFFNDLNTQGNGSADWTIYIDDLSQKLTSETTTSTLITNFDDLTKNHILGEFDGGIASVEEAPDTSTDLQISGKIIGYHETHNLGEEYTELSASARDVYSGDILSDSIDVSESINIDKYETQIITYTAEDGNNNQTELKRFVTLVDNIRPDIVFTGPKDTIVYVDASFSDQGATGLDNIPDNINANKTRTVITQVEVDDTGDGYTSTGVEEITTGLVGHFKIAYSFTDNSGNENSSTRNVFVRDNFPASQAVLTNGVADTTWSNGIMAYDQGIPGYGTCTDGDGCPNIKWGEVTDTEKCRVLQINQLNNDFESGLFISSPNGVDLRGSKENGLLELEIKRQSGSDPYVDIWADCGYPCAGGPSRQGPFVTGEWTTILIPIKDILEGPTSRLDLQIVKAGLLFKAASAKDASYRIANVKWLCLSTTCAGDSTKHEPFDWAATHEDPSKGFDAPTAYDGYALVWSDEFNGNTVNPANWRFDLGNGDDGWGNGELQHYREDNATVDNGLLAIEAQKHQPKLSGDIGYTSAKLKTEDLFEFKYGRVDARAVAAKGQGLWSAIWMLGANHSDEGVGWPRSGEIDILDTIAGNRDGFPQEAMMVNNMYWNAGGSSPDAPYSLGSINQNGSAEYWLNEPTDESYQRPIQWDLNNLPDWMAGPSLAIDNPNTDQIETEIRPLLLTGCEGSSCIDTEGDHKTPVDVDNLPTWITENTDWINWTNDGGSTETFSNTFHVFSLIWTEDKIIFEVDGEKTNEIDIKGALEEHYRQTFYLILNVAVGGDWPKAPSGTTVFNDGMLVDYVRVYQADSDSDGVADYDWDGETVLDQD